MVDQSRVRYRLTFMAKCYDIDKGFGLHFKTRAWAACPASPRGSVLLQNAGSSRECIIRMVEYQTPFLDRADLAAMSTGRLR